MLHDMTYPTVRFGRVLSYHGAELAGSTIRLGYSPCGDAHSLDAPGGIVDVPIDETYGEEWVSLLAGPGRLPIDNIYGCPQAPIYADWLIGTSNRCYAVAIGDLIAWAPTWAPDHYPVPSVIDMRDLTGQADAIRAGFPVIRRGNYAQMCRWLAGEPERRARPLHTR